MISESILEGEKVRLRPVRPADLQSFTHWLADPEVRQWLANVDKAPTLDEEIEWYEETRANDNNVLWAIESLEGELLGTCELRLSPKRHKAELGISIHDKEQWSLGYGTDAVNLMLAAGFEDMDLNRIELTTDQDNARGRRCYEKCGFVEEGVLRQDRFVNGKYGDTIVMSVLREEWQKR